MTICKYLKCFLINVQVNFLGNVIDFILSLKKIGFLLLRPLNCLYKPISMLNKRECKNVDFVSFFVKRISRALQLIGHTPSVLIWC